MPRLWILLLFIWYYVVSTVNSENDDASSKEENRHELILPNSLDNPYDVMLPYKEDLYILKPPEDNIQNQNPPLWSYMFLSNLPNKNERNKRSVTQNEEPPKTAAENRTKNEITKREATGSMGETSRREEIEKFKKIRNPEDIKNIMESSSVQNYIYLLEFLSSLSPLLYNSEYNIPDDTERKIDPEVLRKCLRPIDHKKSFSAWGGKRSLNYFDQMYKECLESLMSQQRSIPYIPDTDNIRKITKLPFKPWHGKRDAEENNGPKRLPFRAWGGKRDKLDDDGVSPKRIPFRAWGGKRNPEVMENTIYPRMDQRSLDEALISLTGDNSKRVNRKKTKFYSWGGKRSEDKRNVLSPQFASNPLDSFTGGFGDYEHLFREPSFSWTLNKDSIMDQNVGSPEIRSVPHRRLKFNSWGGKRSVPIDETLDDLTEDKRTFSAWGGKRSYPMDDFNQLEEGSEQKRKFSAWGGKREAPNDISEMIDEVKRKFSAWGGKRGIYGSVVSEQNDYSDYPDESKRKFSAWGGKRGENDNGLGLNDLSEYSEADKRTFSAWGGKRDALNDMINSDDIEEEKRKFSAWGGKRGLLGSGLYDNSENLEEDKRKFSAWGGKRDMIYPKLIEGDDIEKEDKRTFSAWGGK